jgi:zinc protease
MKPIKYQLKNGLNVLLAESRKSPVVSVQMWVRTGSADEHKSVAGISHFIEHLVFKGTAKYKVGEIAATVEGAGGELNAYTSFDQTVFHVTIDSAQAETALDVIAEMMGRPLFDAQEIDREREVVIEEIKRGQDSPGRRSSQLLFSTCYKNHNYGRPVIGFEQVIKKIKVSEIKKYYKERYCTQNMFLVVTGDFSAADMKKRVQAHYGTFIKNKMRKVKRKQEGKARSVAKVEVADFRETQLSLSWPIPNVKHKDVPALDVLALVLGQGDSSRLTKKLLLEKNLVQGICASAFTPIDRGLFVVSASLESQKAKEALNEIKNEIIKIQTEGPSKEELTKAVSSIASDTIYSLETVDGIARSMGGMEFYLKDPMAFQKYLKKISFLTTKDIAEVAKKYLTAKTITSTALTKEHAQEVKETFEDTKKAMRKDQAQLLKSKIKIKPQNAKIQAFKSKPSQAKSSQIKTVKLSGGGVLLLKEQKETPTVSVRLAFAGGAALEPTNLSGLNELLSRVWTTQTKSFKEDEIYQSLDTLAAGIGAFAGRNTSGLNIDYISQFEDRVWNLAESILLEPTFERKFLERESEQVKQQILRRKDHPSSIAMRTFSEQLFKGHPYARDPLGTTDSIAKIQSKDLVSQYTKIANSGNLMLSIVGDFDIEKWQLRAESLAKKLGKGENLLQNVAHKGPQKNIRVEQRAEKEQAHLVIGMKAYSLTDPKRWALHILQAVLAGQGGRLFLELRDKNSLAYSVSPIMTEGVGTGSFGAYIGCSPEKVKTAEQMIDAEFKKLMDTKITAQELLRAQKYLSGSTAIQMQKKSAVATNILFDTLYGNDPQDGLKPQAKYAQVTAEDVQKVAQELFVRPRVTSIVGV